MCCCRPPPGARRTARSPIPSGASRASARSCRCRAKRSPTGGSSREVARRMGFGDAFAYRSRRRHLPRARRAVGVRERRHARFRYRRPRRRSRDDAFDALDPVAVAVRARRAARRTRFFADGGFFTPDRKARFIAPEPPALARADDRAISAAAQHRPHPRPVAHHDAHRHEPAARRASAGAVRRGASATTPRAPGSSTAASRASRPRMAPASSRSSVSEGQQRGLAVRADPLERRDRVVGARRRSGRAAHRSVLRPAGSEGDAGRDRAGRLSRMRGFALTRAPLALPDGTWWARVAIAGGTGTCSRPTRGRCVWHDFALPHCWADDVCRVRRPRARHLSRRRLRRRQARRLRCSSARPTPRRSGMRQGTVRSRASPIERRIAAVRTSPPTASPKPGRWSAPASASASARSATPSRRGGARASTRSAGAARRHQLRLLPAGTEKDRRP